MGTKKLSIVFSIFAAFITLEAIAASTGLLPRPPQFVLLAFDNCDSPEFWQESLAFSKEAVEEKRPLHFTYFMSANFFLNQHNKTLYTGPKHAPGASDIGFAPDNAFISARIKQINSALENNHEIGSHAVGHFDGTHWLEEDWSKEFSLFYNLISQVFINNKMAVETFILDTSKIVGFRTPYLSYSQDLWPVLNQYHYRYDTSRTSHPNYWPSKIKGIWNFPLGEITIPGTGKKTLSMDYNFHVVLSHGVDDLSHAHQYSNQMYDSYMNYFTNNYNGNRAPVHIGHHFRQMNGGAYWRAMKAFAETVCGFPEVRCVTYSKLADFMDQTSESTIAAYSKGQFEKGYKMELQNVERSIDLNLDFNVTTEGKLILITSGREISNPRVTYVWEVNYKQLKSTNDPMTVVDAGDVFRAAGETTATVTVLAYLGGREIQSATHEIVLVNNQVILSTIKLEDRALLGDLPEAHMRFDSK